MLKIHEIISDTVFLFKMNRARNRSLNNETPVLTP